MQERLSAAGALPRTPLGSLQRSPDPIAGGRETGCPSPTTPPVGPSGLVSPVPPLQIVPISACPHLMQAGDAPESHIGYD